MRKLIVAAMVTVSCADIIGADFGDASLITSDAQVDVLETDASSDAVVADTSPTFDPSSLPDLAFWIDANYGVEIGDAATPYVTRWPDRSGNARDAIPAGNGTNPPTLVLASLNGLPVVHFVAQQFQMLATSWMGPSSTELTMFLVTRGYPNSALRFQTTAGAFPFVIFPIDFVSMEANPNFMFDVGIPAMTYTNVREIISTAVELTSARWRSDGTAATFRNGALVEQRIATTPTLPSGQRLCIGGALPLNAAAFTDGDIAEALIYTFALTDAARAQVEQYLRTKWAVP